MAQYLNTWKTQHGYSSVAQQDRIGMRLTHHERELGQGQSGSGRGWSAKERAAGAW